MGAYNDFSQSISIYPDFVKAYLARAATSVDMRDYDAAEKDRYKAEEIMDRYRRMKDGDPECLGRYHREFQAIDRYKLPG